MKQTKRDDLAKFQMDRRFCWEDVKEMASDSMDKDADAVKWRKNPFRAAGRSLQQGASNLETLLKFLPEGELTGILCGALTLVFCVSERLFAAIANTHGGNRSRVLIQGETGSETSRRCSKEDSDMSGEPTRDSRTNPGLC